MSLADRLFQSAREYEVLAASCDERAALFPERRDELAYSSVAFTVIAICLREIGSILDGEDVE